MGCRNRVLALAMVVAMMASTISSAGQAEDEKARLEKQRAPRPAEFASVFSFGYGGDTMPKEEERYELLLKKLKEGGFNTILSTYTEKRLELCKKHGIKMMLDLLSEADHHVYKSAGKAQAVCEKLRNNPDVWGYNIWNDLFAKTGEGRRRDVNTVRTWDPTHPSYSGTYRTSGMSHLVNADILGYYDFHWKRGIGQHLPHLLAYSKWARERDAWFYTWLAAESGLPGKGNFNRSLYSANTGIACGLKGALWFLGNSLMNQKTLEWTTAGQDIIKVNREIMPLSRELAKVGMPSAIYSTPITKTENNRELPDGKKEMMPPGLDRNGIPKDFWVQPAGGEFLLGVFKDDQKRDAVFVANHNAYEKQSVVLKLSKPVKVSLFARSAGKWQVKELKEGAVRFELAPGGGELLRFGE
jgi:hypothetical protein